MGRDLKLQSGRDALCEKPGPVLLLLEAWIVKASLHDKQPDLEKYCQKALVWWNDILAESEQYVDEPCDEETLASVLLQRLMQDPFWGKVMRKP